MSAGCSYTCFLLQPHAASSVHISSEPHLVGKCCFSIVGFDVDGLEVIEEAGCCADQNFPVDIRKYFDNI